MNLSLLPRNLGYLLGLFLLTTVVACGPAHRDKPLDCEVFMDIPLQHDPLTGESYLGSSYKVIFIACAGADSAEMDWLSIWRNQNATFSDIQSPLTHRDLLTALQAFRADSSYDFTMSMLLRRRRVNRQVYSPETWEDAESYYEDLLWSPAMVDSFHLFLEEPAHRGRTYLDACNEFLWDRAHADGE